MLNVNPVIKTYPEMNVKVVDLLRIGGEFNELYAAQRIEELEAENAALKDKLEKQMLEDIECKAALILTAKDLGLDIKVECHMFGDVAANPVLDGLVGLLASIQQHVTNFDLIPMEETEAKVKQDVKKYLSKAKGSGR